MGFRFRKTIRIAPGVRLNLSKSGISTSIGGGGLTVNSRGRVTASLPGTGLSVSQTIRPGSAGSRPAPVNSNTSSASGCGCLTLLLLGAVLVWPWLLVVLIPLGLLVLIGQLQQPPTRQRSSRLSNQPTARPPAPAVDAPAGATRWPSPPPPPPPPQPLKPDPAPRRASTKSPAAEADAFLKAHGPTLLSDAVSAVRDLAFAMANTPGLEAEIGHPFEAFNLATSAYLVAIIFGRSGYLLCQSSHGQVSDDDITLLYHTVRPFFAPLDGAEALPALEADLDTRRQALKNLCTLDNPTGSLADEAETSLNAFRLLACYDQLRGVRPTSPAALTTKVRRALVRYLHTLADRDGTITDQERNAIDDLHERAGGLIEQGTQFAQQYPQVAAQLERSPFARHTLVLEPLPLEQATRPRRTGSRRSKAAKGQSSAQSTTNNGAQSRNQPDDATAEILQELREMTGLASVKQEINSHINTLKVSALRREAGLAEIQTTNHMVFTGNPGTGKTTVARRLAELYRALGVLTKGTLTEVDRSALVAGYVGQTAIKTKAVIEQARGGILFIDEAYALSTGQGEESFGREAIDTLLKYMEDYREELIVIVAGYSEPMQAFLQSNPGLQSRFNKFIAFPDYSADELKAIFRSFCQASGYRLSTALDRSLDDAFAAMVEAKPAHFGNARTVRNLFDLAVVRQANRVVTIPEPTHRQLMELRKEDITPDDIAAVLR
ncbi:DUF4236 domain-containing protein [Vulcanococcus limneticus]|uniref:DUF4236 domain-containing protein n=1 Tax=Vulcanococcus limneticus TaxID=2170428 RepID=UPI00398BEC29